MAKMIVTYFDIDDTEMRCTVNADDEAAAIGVVLDQLGESIAPASPFAVWREHEPKTMGRKGTGARLIGRPVPNLDIDDEDEDYSEEIVAQDLPDELAVKPSPVVAALLEGVADELGVGVERCRG
jgi:hypothetical protein